MNVRQTISEQQQEILQKAVEGNVYTDPYHLALYSTDASLYKIQPSAVVVPKSTADVQAAMSWAAEQGLEVIPRGSGTSLSGQPIGAGLVLDFSKYMNQILNLDPGQARAVVQPGVVLDQLNRAAAAHQLQFGPDVATSSRANMGGMLGNNSAGARSIRNGKMVDHVFEVDTVLADGSPAKFGFVTPEELAQLQQGSGRQAEIYRQIPRIIAENRDEILARFPRILRRVSGYNLDEFVPETRDWFPAPANVALVRGREAAQFPGAAFNLARLIVGAEGTLATVTEAKVHLIPLPRERGIVVLHFESLDDSCAALAATLELQPSAVEFIDKMIVDMARKSLEYRNYLDFVVGEPESLIIVEFSGDSREDVEGRCNTLVSRLQGQRGLYHVLPAMEPGLRDHIWACRKASLPLLMAIPGQRKPVAFVEDTAVNPAVLPEFVRRFRAILHNHGTDGAFYGHASVGCLHIRPLVDAASRNDLQMLERISHQVADLVLEFGGAMSGEHGDGLARSFLNEKLFGPQLYAAFKQVKAAFDPENRMNPGKVVDGPSPIENLRYGADYRTLPIQTALDFSNQGGFARAVELCNGSGVCRKTQTGTMCPSFMVTGDEEHSTRGRANALRLVLSGALPPEELTGEKLYQTFDLCLQCKGCKGECPTNVDVARMKVEFLHHYYQEHGIPRGVRMMANVAKLNRWGSRLAPFSNWAAKIPGVSWLQEKMFGVDRRRSLPRFHRQHFARWFRQHQAQKSGHALPAPRGKIVLLDDCLTSYCEPNVNRSAVQVLEAAGYDVVLAGLPCCGRAHISKGLVNEAKQLARQNLATLRPYVRQGYWIVGAEPSCLLTLADDYLDLVPGEESRRVAQQVMLIDSLLAKEGIQLKLRRDEKPVMLHGHCHQKALVGAADTVQACRQVCEKVELLDSGCCGMAGSFGYEHYNISMQIGERVLFPSIKGAPDAAIVAPGFSCRHQIMEGTGRVAEHPLEYLARHLEQ
jgi:FAD/FMN-containing dehydrogenase/Fe-S oxidoreductase